MGQTLAGDSEALGQLVERYNRLVHGVILHKLRKSNEVEDIVQDVFCKAYQELPDVREPDKFALWLARMAANQAQDWLRRREMCGKFASRTNFVLSAAPHTVPIASNQREQRYSLGGVGSPDAGIPPSPAA